MLGNGQDELCAWDREEEAVRGEESGPEESKRAEEREEEDKPLMVKSTKKLARVRSEVVPRASSKKVMKKEKRVKATITIPKAHRMAAVSLNPLDITPLERQDSERKEQESERKQKSNKGVRAIDELLNNKRKETKYLQRSHSFNLLEKEQAVLSRHTLELAPPHDPLRLVAEQSQAEDDKFKDLKRIFGADIEIMKEENKSLREEIVLLKKALIEGMRGGNRFVSGVHFRNRVNAYSSAVREAASTKAALQTRRSRPKSGVQSAKTSLTDLAASKLARPASSHALRRRSTGSFPGSELARETCGEDQKEALELNLFEAFQQVQKLTCEREALLKKAFDEQQLQAQVATLQNELDAERQSKSDQVENATAERNKAEKAERLSADRSERIRALQTELSEARLETERQAMRASEACQALEAAKESVNLQEQVTQLKREAAELKRCLATATKESKAQNKQLALQQETIEDLERQVILKDAYANERNKIRGEKEALEKQQKELLEKYMALEREKSRLARELEEEKELGSELRKSAVRQNDSLVDAQRLGDIQILKLETASRDMLRLKEKTMKANVVAQALRMNLESTRLSLKQAEAERNALQSREDRSVHLEASNERLKAELDAILKFCRLQNFKFAPAQLDQGPNEQQEEESSQDVESPPVLPVARNLVLKLRRSYDELQSRVDGFQAAAEASAKDAEKIMQQYESLTKQSLEKVMHSAIRLCVIAPTVNVNMSDKRNAWRQQMTPNAAATSLQQDKIQCKAPLPTDQIKRIIQDKVLVLFGKMFVQKQKGLAPDHRTNLDKWMGELVVTMQSSIERHLKQAFTQPKKIGPG